MKKRMPLFLFFCFLFFVSNIAAQGIDSTTTYISIQGTLKDANGAAIEDGTQNIIFKLYKELEGGAVLWEETADVDVIGGVYSHNLGSVTDLIAGTFRTTVFLGVNVSGNELSPRTQMTYAPYALAVNSAQQIARQGCSGQVGDVKYSILSPTQFAAENGDCWQVMDGSPIDDGKRLKEVYGFDNVPDMSGLFIRAAEVNSVYSANNDPGRTPGSLVAELQEDENKEHTHDNNLAVAPGGRHNHEVGIPHTDGWWEQGTTPPSRSAATDRSNVYNYNLNVNSDYEDDHTHTLNGGIMAAGAEESRPKNRNFYAYIRVD